MPTHAQVAVSSVIAVCTYYLLAWFLFGKDRKTGTIVPLYEPPRDLSPALLRYVWKKKFDDRTFWSGILSLVAKGLATLYSENGTARVRTTRSTISTTDLPKEEQILWKELVSGHTRKGAEVHMLSPATVRCVGDMSDFLRCAAVGRWFTENRAFVVAGALLSAVALCLVAGPQFPGQWEALILGLVAMAPSAFYLYFLLPKAWDFQRAAREAFNGALLRRGVLLLLMILPCIAGLILGAAILGGTFGWQLVATTIFFSISNVLFLQWMKAPTHEGSQLLTEIEGFRLFLRSVERLPMQRSEAPSDHAGLYEKYLPYAVALDLEQAWGDQFVALASTHHATAGIPGAESFYLGMFNGKPLEIIYKPDPPKGRAF